MEYIDILMEFKNKGYKQDGELIYCNSEFVFINGAQFDNYGNVIRLSKDELTILTTHPYLFCQITVKLGIMLEDIDDFKVKPKDDW